MKKIIYIMLICVSILSGIQAVEEQVTFTADAEMEAWKKKEAPVDDPIGLGVIEEIGTGKILVDIRAC